MVSSVLSFGRQAPHHVVAHEIDEDRHAQPRDGQQFDTEDFGGGLSRRARELSEQNVPDLPVFHRGYPPELRNWSKSYVFSCLFSKNDVEKRFGKFGKVTSFCGQYRSEDLKSNESDWEEHGGTKAAKWNDVGTQQACHVTANSLGLNFWNHPETQTNLQTTWKNNSGSFDPKEVVLNRNKSSQLHGRHCGLSERRPWMRSHHSPIGPPPAKTYGASSKDRRLQVFWSKRWKRNNKTGDLFQKL